MYISGLKIKNYRSLESLNVKLDKLNVLCGPNSSGKSNILRAIKLAFEDISLDKRVVGELVRNNLTKSKITSSASILIEIIFQDAPVSLYTLGQESKTKALVYKFKLTKSGNVTRKLGSVELDDEGFKKLTEKFSVVYIPTIRDLENDGLKPFMDLFKRAIQSAHGGREMKNHLSDIKKTLSKKASSLLGEQKSLVQSVLNARAIELSTEHIELDSVYENLTLQVKNNAKVSMPMEYFGTGHQSALIINLYKQFGEAAAGKTLYLFEEPDAHLHPPTIRTIGKQIDGISNNSQVLVSTHSPILISQLGLEKVIHLKLKNSSGTQVTPSNLEGSSQSVLNHRLLKYGLRVTEALFTKLVILVEGATDAIVVGRLIELKSGKSSDQMDLLITPAGGKDNIVDIAEILEMLGVEWVAIFDFDAALTTSSIPITQGGIIFPEEMDVIEVIDNLLDDLDLRQKRGKKARTQLELIKNEIQNGVPRASYYDDSTLQDLMERVLGITTRNAANLKSAIRNERVHEIRQILGENNIWLMRPDLENTLIGRNGSNSYLIDPILRNAGRLNTDKNSPNYSRALINSLHQLSSAPEVLVEVVDAVENHSGLNRTDINLAVKEIVKNAE